MSQGEDVVTILKKAKQVLMEKGWTQGNLARDCHGREVPTNDGSAARFCMIGAVYFAAGADDRQGLHHQSSADIVTWTCTTPYPAVLYATTRLLVKAVSDATNNECSDTTIFNDMPGRTKAQCLEVYDLAIVLATTN